MPEESIEACSFTIIKTDINTTNMSMLTVCLAVSAYGKMSETLHPCLASNFPIKSRDDEGG